MNPHDLAVNGFSYHLRFSPPPPIRHRRGLWSGLSLHRTPDWLRDLGAARLVSTPSRFRAWLGIAISQASPNLSGSASAVSRQSTQSSLKSVASTRFRHARTTVSYYSLRTNISQENSINRKAPIVLFISFLCFWLANINSRRIKRSPGGVIFFDHFNAGAPAAVIALIDVNFAAHRDVVYRQNIPNPGEKPPFLRKTCKDIRGDSGSQSIR